MNDETWQQTHLLALIRRLSQLKSKPDGMLHEETSGPHQIRIIKHVGQIHFYFVDPASGALDGPMSRIELDRPLRLLAEYTQAAMLTLLWRPEPARVCLLGLAGGRLALLFYHAFPHVTIDNVDVEPSAGAIAAAYFGLTFDRRQRIAVRDARAYLRELGAEVAYDILIMDAFSDASDNLDHLATTQFYQECRARLARGGVICVNILKSDQLFFEKVKTFLASFPHVVVSEHKRSLVLFGSDQKRPPAAEIAQKAAMLQHRHGFEFAFVERAAALKTYRE
ncbi:MAG: fused MFS/spermidine synthase, partial [Roseiflexaceae bacterium]